MLLLAILKLVQTTTAWILLLAIVMVVVIKNEIDDIKFKCFSWY